MIEKMKFVSITGPKEDFDRMVGTYLAKHEVHLENALSELKTVQNLTPFLEKNPYKDKLTLVSQYIREMPDADKPTAGSMDCDRATTVIEQVQQAVTAQEK